MACPGDPLISVVAASDELAFRVCETVARVRPALAACHLRQVRALAIDVVPKITHPNAGCIAQYDCRDERTAATDPAALPDVLGPDSIRRRIAPEALFDSLIVHELVHAFLDQSDCQRQPCLTEHEYIAYALQIDTLNPADRRAILESHRITDPADPRRLNDFMLAAAPDHFAQAVWLHFSQPGNGCAFVGDLVRGVRTLRVDPY
ncbi:DUF6639 family protein [Rhodovulum sp. ES.010]|uniref:DUF6639 family protein n=1 Tax=Rhodovulum sp. ES.010 TaxID=1882821 RepID=UPI001588023E|nr:DUF6639 family protein [Rhodovulum sp. ES.010]